MFATGHWAGVDSPVSRRVIEQTEACLRAYRENPLLVEEHANDERATAEGGYGHRQIYELIQNGADELLDSPGGCIKVLLTDDVLYCANEGTPITVRGAEAILSARLSVKRGNQIGRFGMGFKSVLGITRLPDFFSRSGSFRFDPEWSEKRVREVVPSAERTPILRTAYPLDAIKASETDPILRDLMAWATTIVRLPVDRNESAWLSEHIEKGFPGPFLVFASHVGKLILEDTLEHVRRTISMESSGNQRRLDEGTGVSTWRVFETTHRPSPEARKVAGELADRDEVPIVWAVPEESKARGDRGTFWAFFPTEYRTTLSGILNAPWKTNEDRQNLLTGRFNEELIEAAARLIVNNLAELSGKIDPASHLDVMPASRDKESPGWADKLLFQHVYELASKRPSLPDQTGDLQRPGELQVPPKLATRPAVDEWNAYPNRPSNWPHPSVHTRERLPRAERLFEIVGSTAVTISAWLEALVSDQEPNASIAALRTAGRILEENPRLDAQIRNSSIVATETSGMRQPHPDHIFLPGKYATRESLIYVHPDVCADPIARSVLESLGIAEANPSGELASLVAAGDAELTHDGWISFWELVRRVDNAAAARILGKNSTRFVVRVLTRSGAFSPARSVLVPGPVVGDDDEDDAHVTLDRDFHESDLELLRTIGCIPAPEPGAGSVEEPWFRDYRRACMAEYLETLPRNFQQPRLDYLEFVEDSFVGPLTPLQDLSDEARSRLTYAALAAETEPHRWHMRHRSRQDYYPTTEMPTPVAWFCRRQGRIPTSLGYVAPSAAVGPEFDEWRELLPVTEIPELHRELLAIPGDPPMLGNQWNAAFERARTVGDDDLLGRFYAFAAMHCSQPETIRARVDDSHQMIPPADVTVVTDRREFDALAGEGIPVLWASAADARILREIWGLLTAAASVRVELEHADPTRETPILDRWPFLKIVLAEDDRDLQLIACDWLRIATVTERGRGTDPVDVFLDREHSAVFHRDGLADDELLRQVSAELELGLSETQLERIAKKRADREREKLRKDLIATTDTAERLLRLVGPAALRRLLPTRLVEAALELHGEVDDLLLARLALASRGVGILRELRPELEAGGWSPPRRWAGSRYAREFVQSIGFGSEFSGFPQADRDPLVRVDGPLTLNRLHPFQLAASNQLRDLIQTDPTSTRGEKRKGLLSLPTGAGKTRVVVQTLVEAIRDDTLDSPILWIAQTDELCEQAVQSWSDVWRALGPEDRLYVGRLWSGNEASALPGSHHVVIATISKLGVIAERPEYDWLAETTLVVIDEAHGSTAPSYSRIMRWLGVDTKEDRVPLVGLTATPFRGRSTDETKRLVQRYGSRRIDADIFDSDPYRYLQEHGVLAEVEHELLEGSKVHLTSEELSHLKEFRSVPASVEDRIGADVGRNRMLLESIKGLPEDWPVLLFATSVEHAQVMAALLTMDGIQSAAISAQTEPGARRHYIERFRENGTSDKQIPGERVRVLTNYGVLTQGFDAPKVRAVYVARPTFSPNLYQQMIGRGLRGPANGGEDKCLIVNVADNFLQFGEQLAFRDFEYLWE